MLTTQATYHHFTQDEPRAYGIFITPERGIASVPVSVRPVLSVGSPTTLFHAPGIATDWSVAADGSLFLVMAPEAGPSSTSLSLVFNWQGALDRER